MARSHKMFDVLAKPSVFFTDLRKEAGIEKAFRYFVVLSFFNTVLGAIAGRLIGAYYADFLSNLLGIPINLPAQSVLMTVTGGAMGYLGGIVFSFAAAGLLHGWIYIFGGKADYTKTYQLWVYSQTPRLLVGWIPLVSFVASLYDVVLLIIGTEKVHGVKKSTALLMYVIPLVLLYAFIAAMIVIGWSFIVANPGILSQVK